METKRQRQVAEMVKRHFSVVLMEEGSYIYGSGVMVTITGVKMTPDFSTAKIYLSVFNTDNKQAVMLQLEDEKSRLHQGLAFRLRKHLRRVPALSLFLDDTLDEMYHVDNLFDQLYKDNQMGKPEEEGGMEHGA
ncbi:MAG: ribosome-binding factor A [Saprospiraceae bacterium]|nr:ribosome-binding factor A [Saprospiraceae bacterium]